MRHTFKSLLACIILLFSTFSCKSVTPVTGENIIPLKYPVVLVHGVQAHDRGKPKKFWGRIPAELEKNGIKVFFGKTDAWGDYESNAKMLHDTIEKYYRKQNVKK